ncbi:MAG: hypothetical protein JJE16_11245 [Nitrospiraceae bacterium]|nr:hypothetical protein [Nitrospiraceae bacterium]
MDPIDFAILTSCVEDFRPLKPLLKTIPKGTLYRHAKRLTQIGWLAREGRRYQTTDAGRRQLHAAHRGRRWNQFDILYPPVKDLPTDVHRAVFELALAAVICRQSKTRADRHPFLVCAGGTLRWKSSLGIFLCHALGLDPGGHLVECAVEAGKSLFVRRDAEGTVVYKRDLLGTPFIVLDEFQAAAPAVRAALYPLLSGRLVVPLENDRLTVSCVPLVLLNPVEKPVLEQRLGLSAPLIRRALIANLDAVAMPDVALIGERALVAARAQTPLTLSEPTIDCQQFDRRIIDLLRGILNDDAAERIDLQMIVNLCSGMTAWLPDPTESIAQVAHGVGILAETMAWSRPGWIEVVTDFSLDQHKRPQPIRMEKTQRQEGDAQSEVNPSQTIALQIPKVRREPNLPDLALSDALRGRLAWLAVETGRPVDEVLNLLFEVYVKWQRQPETVATLWKILSLARTLNRAEVDIDDLHGYLCAEAALRKHQCRFEDVPEALRLIECLMALPRSWTWTMAAAAVQGVAVLIKAGIEAPDVEKLLQRHQRLSQLGFEEEEAEAVAEALIRAGAVGRQRTRVLNRMVAQAGKVIHAAELEGERMRLEQRVTLLRAEQAQLEASVQLLKNQRDTLHPHVAQSAHVE